MAKLAQQSSKTDSRRPVGRLPGIEANRPTEIPAAGWKQIVKRAWQESKQDSVPLLAAGVAFFAFLAIFPAIIAVLNIYGLVADPRQAAEQVQSFASALPEASRRVITDQLQAVAASSGGALSFGLVVSVLAALWSASGGTMNLIKAVNLAYDEDETRGFVKLRGLAVLLTFGAIAFTLVALGLIAGVPALLGRLNLGTAGQIGIQVVRWGGLALFVMAALALVYRMAPDRDAPRLRWVSLGAVVATVLWVAGSVLFSLYVSNFGSYNKTYGAIAGVIVLMLWLYLTCYIVLLGAEINSESEHQTAQDTTRGEPTPMGERQARMSDTLPPDG